MVTLGECLRIRDRQKDYSQKEQNKTIILPPWEGGKILVVHSPEIQQTAVQKINIPPARAGEGGKIKCLCVKCSEKFLICSETDKIISKIFFT